MKMHFSRESQSKLSCITPKPNFAFQTFCLTKVQLLSMRSFTISVEAPIRSSTYDLDCLSSFSPLSSQSFEAFEVIAETPTTAPTVDRLQFCAVTWAKIHPGVRRNSANFSLLSPHLAPTAVLVLKMDRV